MVVSGMFCFAPGQIVCCAYFEDKAAFGVIVVTYIKPLFTLGRVGVLCYAITPLPLPMQAVCGVQLAPMYTIYHQS